MKIRNTILVMLIMIGSHVAVIAQQTYDWATVKSFVGQEIFVQTQNKGAVFGILRGADDGGITLQVANRRSLDPQSTLFLRNEVAIIRSAELRFGGRNTGKGALIGAGAGAAAGFLTVLARRKDGDGQTALAVPAFTIYGAGIGAVVGFFVKKSHKKGKMIYTI